MQQLFCTPRHFCYEFTDSGRRIEEECAEEQYSRLGNRGQVSIMIYITCGRLLQVSYSVQFSPEAPYRNAQDLKKNIQCERKDAVIVEMKCRRCS